LGETRVSGTGIDFILAVIAGILGGVVVGKAMKEHSLGIFVDAIAGGIGAVLGGLFLRHEVLSLVNASGDVTVAGTSVDRTALLILAGAVEGGAWLSLSDW
jgi:uncharacterized membrane protein YeaQ/YmgE (transglycosylase-associated protein family)